MKAVLCKTFGPPEMLVVEEVPEPSPRPGEAIVAVRAIGLNFFDTLIIENKYQFRPQPPFSPGSEFAGTVAALGDGVSGLAVGDRVMGYIPYGSCAERLAVAASQLTKIPDALDFRTAAALTVTYGTSLHALKDRAALAPGETVAILGAAGGVGQAAIELAKVMGARVIAAASSEDKLDACREIGADETINYATAEFKERLKELTGGRGADVVYDPVGGEIAEQALRATAWGGRYLVIGFASGVIPRIPLNLVLLKGCQMVGVFWGAFTERDRQGHQANMRMLIDWCVDGRINPRIFATYPLEDTPRALMDFVDRRVLGKIVIETGGAGG